MTKTQSILKLVVSLLCQDGGLTQTAYDALLGFLSVEFGEKFPTEIEVVLISVRYEPATERAHESYFLPE